MTTNTGTPAHLTVTVETRILGWGADTVRVPLETPHLSVAALLRAKAGAEWAEWEAGHRADVGRESLSPEHLMGQEQEAPPDTRGAAERRALNGYRAGWYIVLVDGEQPGGLDARLSLRPDSSIAFVRVYPLPDAPPRAGERP